MLIEVWLSDLVSVGYKMLVVKIELKFCLRNIVGGEINLYYKEMLFLYLRVGKELK